MTPESRSAYPGEKLGLPQRGPGSLAPMGPRLGALMIDWLISYGLAALAMRLGWFSASALATAVLVIWFVLGWSRCGCSASRPASWCCGCRW